MHQDETGIGAISARRRAGKYFPGVTLLSRSWNYYYNIAALLLCVSVSLFGPADVFAQQTLVIDVNVFGVNSNQETASLQLLSACAAIEDGGSEGALDLLLTCDSIAELDRNDPDDIAQLQEILDVFAPEEAFSVNDSIVYVSDYQTTNVYARIDSLRSAPSASTNTTTPDSSAQSDVLQKQFSVGGELASISSVSGGGAAAGELTTQLGVFFTGQLSNGDVDGSTFEQDADFNSNSFTVGADYRFNKNVVVGIGLGVLQNKTEFTSVDGGTESEGFNLTAFGSWYEEDQGYIDAVLDFGSSSHDLERAIGNDPGAPVLAIADTDSSAISFTVSAGRYFSLSKWDLGGYFRMSLTKGTIDGYTEEASNINSGSGSVFSFDSQSVESTKMVVGVEASQVINTSKAVLIPVIRIEYEIENEKEKDDVEATLVAAPVSAAYRGTSRDTAYANLGVGANAILRNGKSAYVFYETHLQHDFVTQNWLKFGLRLEF